MTLPATTSGSNPSSTNIPRLNTPFVDQDGIIEKPWLRLLIGMYNKLGGTSLTPPFVLNTPGGTPASIQLNANPQIYTAPGSGMVIVWGADWVEFARDGNWYTVSKVGTSISGGAIPMTTGDEIRVTWTPGNVPPTITWMPGI